MDIYLQGAPHGTRGAEATWLPRKKCGMPHHIDIRIFAQFDLVLSHFQPESGWRMGRSLSLCPPERRAVKMR